jgi:hypothetical protein
VILQKIAEGIKDGFDVSQFCSIWWDLTKHPEFKGLEVFAFYA